MKTLPLFFLKGIARQKPAGWYDVALTYGTVKGVILELTDEQWEALQPQLEIFEAPKANRTIKVQPRRARGLGDVLEKVAKPVAKLLKLGCLDDKGKLKPTSGCAKRRDRLNKMVPFKAS